MIDKNNDCVTKSKLTRTVKILSKYNGRSRVAAKQKKTGSEKTQKHLGRKHTNGTKRHSYK